MSVSVYDTLARLNITLPAVSAPAAAYVMATQSGNTVYLSGCLLYTSDAADE